MSGTPKIRLPPLKALLAFEAASRHGSFSRGAEELGVTPSAVSHHIQQLEDFLGVPLPSEQVADIVSRCRFSAFAIVKVSVASGGSTQAERKRAGLTCLPIGPTMAASCRSP